MINFKKFVDKNLTQIQIGTAILLLAAIGTSGYFIYSLFRDIIFIKKEMASSKASTGESLTVLGGQIKDLQSGLAIAAKTNEELAQSMQSQQNSLGQTLSGLAGTVNTLEKLSRTDRELLQKYSKVYFLNENYVPVQLATIDQKYLQNKDANQKFHTVVLPFLTKMIDDSAGDPSSTLLVNSAYRSFGLQSALKKTYLYLYGTGANSFSADQGYSEHQLGTAVDLNTPSMGSVLDIKFETTPAFIWLTSNAYKYGFVLSYPKNNAFYQYEPWHWRFVGVELATKLHNENKNFYDLPQREIDTYLTKIFDQSPH